MKLQPRDLKLFSMVFKYGVLTTKQLEAVVFKNVAITTILRRLRKLESTGYIYRITGLAAGELAWVLSKRGAFVIHEEEPYRFTNKNVLFHEVALTSVRLALESIGLGDEWIKDKDLYRMKEHHGRREERAREVMPDGFFMAMRNGIATPIAVELELSAKSQARYKTLLYEYSFKHQIKYLWYIVGDEKIAALLKRAWKRVSYNLLDPQLVVTNLSELLENPSTAKMEFVDGEKLLIFKVLDVLSEVPTHGPQAALGVSSLDRENFENKNADNNAKEIENISAPDFRVSRPFTADPSPSTSDGEGSALTGKELVSGADKVERKCA